MHRIHGLRAGLIAHAAATLPMTAAAGEYRVAVDWYNNRRLFEPIANIPPAEAEAHFYAQ